jgi:hypothetical protein
MVNLTISTNRGYDIAAIYTKPEIASDKYSFVLLLHGFSGWKEEEHISTLADGFAKAGIASLRLDAPGSGESSGNWQDDYRVSNYLGVIREIVDYAVENLAADPNRVGIWGHSMGGMTTIIAAGQHLYDFKAVCGSQPSPGNIGRDYRDDPQYWQEHDGITINSEHFGTFWLPAAHFVERMQYKAPESVKNIHVPILFIAGDNDDLVPAEHVRVTFDAANEPKQYLEYHTDHFYKRNPAVLEQINQDTVAFFVKALKE